MGVCPRSYDRHRPAAWTNSPTTLKKQHHERTNNVKRLKHISIYGMALALSSGCALGTPAQIGTGLVLGPEIDRQINEHVLGGTPGHTFTTDDNMRRAEGDTAAKDRCALYDVVLWPVDLILVRSGNQGRDHCEEWCLIDTGGDTDRCLTENRHKPGQTVNYNHMHNQGEWIK